MLFAAELQDKHVDVLMAIADGLIHNVLPEVVRPAVDGSIDEARIAEYTRQVTKPSEIPGYREFVQLTISNNSTRNISLFVLLMLVLDLRVLALPLTGTTTLIREMLEPEREALLLLWRNSPLEPKQRLFRLLCNLVVSTFQRCAPELHHELLGWPQREKRAHAYEGWQDDGFRYKMMEPPALDSVELYLPNIDVAVVGSGAGAGVVVDSLAREGFRCLVIEKGKYFAPEQLTFDDKDGYKALYEGGGAVVSKNSQVFILAGATFGGGTTVNWLACLKTPFKVRKEWYDDHKLDWIATDEYEAEMDYVLQAMGATSTERIKHSFSNDVMLKGAEKLGYKARAVYQNNGGHDGHLCGMCYLGCPWSIKQGGVAYWFRYAAEHGLEFMDQVLVQRIVRSRGVAVALECVNVRNGFRFTIRGPRKFVVAGGLLMTPVLLQKLGFKNRHIGRNLKLHPISVLSGVFDQRTDPQENSIMTTVCTEVEDVDGKAHGSKIETLLHAPVVEVPFLPYHNSNQIRQDMMKFQRVLAYIFLTRDTSLGLVTYDRQKPDTLEVDYVVNKQDRAAMVKAMLVTADVLYVEGAREIIHPYWRVDRFVLDKPKAQRRIEDSDYQAWRKTVETTPLTLFGSSYGLAHQMSSCRMSGKGPSDGACDTRGRLFECDNVYIADALTLPTASGSNPMVSTMAVARHVAKGLAKDLRPAARL